MVRHLIRPSISQGLIQKTETTSSVPINSFKWELNVGNWLLQVNEDLSVKQRTLGEPVD